MSDYLFIARNPLTGESREQEVTGPTMPQATANFLRRKWVAEWLAESGSLTFRVEAK